jgi:hypothetical protein
MSEVQEWKHHPVTQRLFKAIDEAVLAYKQDLPIIVQDNPYGTAMRNCYAQGWMTGILSIQDAVDHLEGNND